MPPRPERVHLKRPIKQAALDDFKLAVQAAHGAVAHLATEAMEAVLLSSDPPLPDHLHACITNTLHVYSEATQTAFRSIPTFKTGAPSADLEAAPDRSCPEHKHLNKATAHPTQRCKQQNTTRLPHAPVA